MKKACFSLCSLLVVFASFGCSQDVEEEKQDTESKGRVISVEVNDQKVADADVSGLKDKVIEVTVGNEKSKALTIADIIEASAGIKKTDLPQYMCDYESGDDGFRPSSKGDRCPPVSCTEAVRSYYNYETHILFYSDDAPMKNGCYSVSNLAKILMYDVKIEDPDKQTQTPENNEKKEYPSYEIVVNLDGQEIGKVDVSKLADNVKSVGGVDVIYASDIIKAVKADIDLQAFYCDYIGSDGFKPLDSGSDDCKLVRSCSYASQAFYELVDNAKNKLRVDDGNPTCYAIKFFKTIEIYSTDPNKAE